MGYVVTFLAGTVLGVVLDEVLGAKVVSEITGKLDALRLDLASHITKTAQAVSPKK